MADVGAAVVAFIGPYAAIAGAAVSALGGAITLRFAYRDAERAGPISLGRWFVGLGAMVVAWWEAVFLAQWMLWIGLPSAAGILALAMAVLAALYVAGERHLAGAASRWLSVSVFGASVAVHALMLSMLRTRAPVFDDFDVRFPSLISGALVHRPLELPLVAAAHSAASILVLLSRPSRQREPSAPLLARPRKSHASLVLLVLAALVMATVGGLTRWCETDSNRSPRRCLESKGGRYAADGPRKAASFACFEHRLVYEVTTVIMSGWKPGLRKISLAHLIRARAHLPLSVAKHQVDALLDDRPIAITLDSREAAEQFAQEALALGAICACREDGDLEPG